MTFLPVKWRLYIPEMLRYFSSVLISNAALFVIFLLVDIALSKNETAYGDYCFDNRTWIVKENVGIALNDSNIQNGWQSLYDCGMLCCMNSQCSVALYMTDSCILLKCGTSKSCLNSMNTTQILASIFIRNSSANSINDLKSLNTLNQGNAPVICNASNVCDDYEICTPIANSSSCFCPENFIKNAEKACVRLSDSESTLASQLTEAYVVTTEAAKCCGKPCQALVITAESKTISLPENSVTLSAFTIQGQENTSFTWSPVSHKNGVDIGTMTDTSSATLKLTGLKEGVYGFKVEGHNTCGESGEAHVNVTVLPALRINKPPIAKIFIPNQVIQLPQTTAVLDGGTSSDDDKIVSFKWEVLKSPILFHSDLPPEPTITLDHLIVGNYSVQLTVKDSDNATNSAIANLTVIPDLDWAPKAVAGEDVIVFLPQNNITLNGNLSTDDKGIDSWEWIKDASGEDKAVDMQNTRTPYLQLSGLEEGVYKFILKVTDTASQTATDDITVFVKRPSSEVPIANAGNDIRVDFPVDAVLLNGTNSKSVNPILRWKWSQISGPTKVDIHDSQKPICTVMKPKVGIYKFLLEVFTDRANGSDNVTVTVVAAANRAPVAIVGKDMAIQLPMNEIILNGSQSNDDYGIVKWKWSRDGSSLSAGQVIGNSDEEPILRLINLVPGRYLFKLRVEDEQGLSSEASSSLIVNPNPQYKDHIRLTLNAPVEDFTESQKELTAKRLSLLLSDAVDIEVLQVYGEEFTDKATLVFLAKKQTESKENIVNGLDVVRQVKARLRNDDMLLGIKVLRLDTLVCQNECSGHGVCDEATRTCICEAFWIENPFRRYAKDEINCDWSILYVIIVLLVCLVISTIVIWGGIYACRHQKTPVRKRQRYSLLRGADMADKKTTFNKNARVFESLDSDGDSDSPEELVLINGMFGSKKSSIERNRDVSDGLQSFVPNAIS